LDERADQHAERELMLLGTVMDRVGLVIEKRNPGSSGGSESANARERVAHTVLEHGGSTRAPADVEGHGHAGGNRDLADRLARVGDDAFALTRLPPVV
jgi:hypothetical protein